MARKRKIPPPGAAHNRTDIPNVPTGLRYGEASKLGQAQSAVPVPSAPAPPSPGGAAAPPGPGMDFQQVLAQAQAYPTEHIPTLEHPTNRPDEPITAGMATGPGPGMDFNQIRNDPTVDMITRLEAFYQRWPTNELRSLLSEARRNAT